MEEMVEASFRGLPGNWEDYQANRFRCKPISLRLNMINPGRRGRGLAVVAAVSLSEWDQAAKATKELIDRSITSVQRGSGGVVKKDPTLWTKNSGCSENTMGVIQDIAKAGRGNRQVREGIDQIYFAWLRRTPPLVRNRRQPARSCQQGALMKGFVGKVRLRTLWRGSQSRPQREEPAEASGAANAFSKY